jgi:hypothetical protein
VSEWFQSLGPVEWFGEQFDPEQVTAASLFRMMLLSWVVAAIAFIVLDRLGSMLLGRSRPLAQIPPDRARAWRWGRREPPENFSLAPPGTTIESTVPYISAPMPLDRPLALMPGPVPSELQLPDPALALEDPEFWRLFAEDTAPVFGFENSTRLGKGEAPERYNPVTGRVEALSRDADAGTLDWQWAPSKITIVGDES